MGCQKEQVGGVFYGDSTHLSPQDRQTCTNKRTINKDKKKDKGRNKKTNAKTDRETKRERERERGRKKE
jgi:hypothetical protein